jgi:hypothetical protein
MWGPTSTHVGTFNTKNQKKNDGQNHPWGDKNGEAKDTQPKKKES